VNEQKTDVQFQSDCKEMVTTQMNSKRQEGYDGFIPVNNTEIFIKNQSESFGFFYVIFWGQK
jgi:hypothetical protein